MGQQSKRATFHRNSITHLSTLISPPPAIETPSKETQIIIALELIKRDPSLSVRYAAALYGVPRTTLTRRQSGTPSRYDSHRDRCQGAPPPIPILLSRPRGGWWIRPDHSHSLTRLISRPRPTIHYNYARYFPLKELNSGRGMSTHARMIRVARHTQPAARGVRYRLSEYYLREDPRI